MTIFGRRIRYLTKAALFNALKRKPIIELHGEKYLEQMHVQPY